MYTFMTFTLFLGAYMTVSVASGGKHVVASLMFQFTLGWVLMLLYSLPSFCCSMSIFDIKFAGIVGYSTMLFIASSVGALAAIKMAQSEHAKAGKVMDMHAHLVHTVIPVGGGMLFMMGALWSVRQALDYYHPNDFLTAIIIYAWTWPADTSLRWYQYLDRRYFNPLVA